MARFLVDSNVFIYAEVAEFEEHRTAVSALERARTSLISTNAIVMSEVHYKLGRLLGWKEAERRCSNIIRSAFVVYEPLFKQTMSRAFAISRSYNTTTNDALIAQHCIDLGDRLLTDNMKDFKRIQGLEVTGLR